MKLVLQFDKMYPISVNDMYIPTSRGKTGRGAFLRKSGDLINFQNMISIRLDDYVEEIDEFLAKCQANYEYLGFKVTVWLGMNDMFLKRQPDKLRALDTSNYFKALEDAISTRFQIDDRCNMEVHAIKYQIDELSPAWLTTIQIEPVNYMDYVKDKIVPPEVGFQEDSACDR